MFDMAWSFTVTVKHSCSYFYRSTLNLFFITSWFMNLQYLTFRALSCVIWTQAHHVILHQCCYWTKTELFNSLKTFNNLTVHFYDFFFLIILFNCKFLWFFLFVVNVLFWSFLFKSYFMFSCSRFYTFLVSVGYWFVFSFKLFNHLKIFSKMV